VREVLPKLEQYFIDDERNTYWFLNHFSLDSKVVHHFESNDLHVYQMSDGHSYIFSRITGRSHKVQNAKIRAAFQDKNFFAVQYENGKWGLLDHWETNRVKYKGDVFKSYLRHYTQKVTPPNGDFDAFYPKMDGKKWVFEDATGYYHYTNEGGAEYYFKLLYAK
jgi:hypothetical protein